MVNMYDGDSDQNDVMDQKWAKGQRRQPSASHTCILIPEIILLFLKYSNFSFLHPKKILKFSYLNVLTNSRAYSKSLQVCHSTEHFFLGSYYPYNFESS